MYRNAQLERITKREAREKYKLGWDIILYPCKLDIEKESESNVMALEIDKSMDGFSYSQGKYISFDSQVSEYEEMNCNNRNGRYCAFYVFHH